MPGSISQSRETADALTGTTIQLAFLSNNLAHNVLWVVAHSDNSGGATQSVADTLGNSYSAALDTLIDADNGNRLSHWLVSDCLGGANTVTITFSVSAQFRAIYIAEITGVQNAANDGHNARHQLNPGTGADAVTSNAATNTATAFMIALSNDDSGNDNAPTIGTGFSLDRTAWNFATPGATIEFKSGVPAASNTATFTAITATDDPNTLMVMLKESVVSNIGITLGVAGPGLSPGYAGMAGSARFTPSNWWPYSPPAGVAFDESLMAAMNRPWPDTIISLPQVVASGMTPPDNVPT